MTTPSAPRTASSAFLLAMANFATSKGNLVSLHTADPQDSGVAEVVGGKYARQPTAWSPAVMKDGEATGQGTDCTFSLPANTSCTHFGVWDSANTFLYGAALDPPVNVSSGGDGLAIVSPRYGELPGPPLSVGPALTLAGSPTGTAGAAGGTTPASVTTLAGAALKGIDGGTP